MIEKYYLNLFKPEYFKKRVGNDPKRQASFLSEKKFINQYIKSGNLLDVGCSTGEFIKTLEWDGHTYGMEISEHAKSIAMENGINFDKNILNSENFFDIIIFRGTIQYMDEPFSYLKKSFLSLKKGGFIFFLATPNTNCLYYKIWNTLPFLDPEANFYIPSDHDLKRIMRDFGFDFVKIRYPYFKSPYSSVFIDHFNFFRKLLGVDVKFPFWRNSMDLIFQKPINI